jgi:hypothetical protein
MSAAVGELQVLGAIEVTGSDGRVLPFGGRVFDPAWAEGCEWPIEVAVERVLAAAD